MQAPLYCLIRQFQRATGAALGEVLTRSGLAHPFDWRTSGRPLAGTLPGEPPLEYRFHGAGLEVRGGQLDVDFDFGFDGRTMGFSEYWLARFVETRPSANPEFLVDATRLAGALQQARAAGEIVQPFRHRQDALLYLREDAHE